MSQATLYCGDALAILKTLPAESVQCVVTSPPYWGLRDYGVPGQLGLEPTPGEYVQRMVEVFRQVRHVLRDDGTLWLNMGDSYATPRNNWLESGAIAKRGWHGGDGLKAKDLCGIPWRLAFALQADGWWLRSDIVWSKPNPMPESVTDRPTRSHEYVFLLSKSARYYYDAAAIAERLAASTVADRRMNGDGTAPRPERGYPGQASRGATLLKPRRSGNKQDGHGQRHEGFNARWDASEAAGETAATRNARTVWEIAPQPYPKAHFATFPEELARRCILAGSSPKACEQCGAPWERVVHVEYVKSPVHGPGSVVGRHYETGANNYDGAGMPRLNRQAETVGWKPTCLCEQEGTGRSVVLDPFGGSGTVAQVATGNGRNSIYIDLNPTYLELARQRIGPMLCAEGVA